MKTLEKIDEISDKIRRGYKKILFVLLLGSLPLFCCDRGCVCNPKYADSKKIAQSYVIQYQMQH